MSNDDSFEEILKGTRALWPTSGIAELRCLDTSKRTQSGYFDNPETLAREAHRLDKLGLAEGVRAVYVTVNPVDPSLLARANNRIVPYAKVTTADAQVMRRTRLPIDLDAKRPAGISATDEEHDAARMKGSDVRAYLMEKGWPAPLLADSGNGSHLVFSIDLPNDESTRLLLQGVLKALAGRFDDDEVQVDQSVFNAARIWKLPGTWVRKGDAMPERPHRRAALLDCPERFGQDVVTVEQLRALVPPPAVTVARVSHAASEPAAFNLETFLREHVTVKRGPEAHDGGDRWIVQCPFNAAHGGTSTAILRLSSGAVSFKCHHNECVDRKWPDVRERFEPGYRERGKGKREGQDAAPIDWDDTSPWPILHPAALYGLPGRIVNALAPHTEADPAALLSQLLTVCGNMIGPGPFIRVGSMKHETNLFTVVVGASAKARKGQSLSDVLQIARQADPDLVKASEVTGLSTGEGLIARLSDPEDGSPVEKRVLIRETEFAKLLAVCGRDGATIPSVIRQLFDRETLRVLTRNSPLAAEGAFGSFIAHITVDELVAKLNDVSLANGFANRFMFICARRGPLLPDGGSLQFETVVGLGAELRTALDRARTRTEMLWSPTAKAAWRWLYARFTDEPGLAGAVIARDTAHTLRLTLTIALLSGAEQLEAEHLLAGFALWCYAEDSARHIFGKKLGDDVRQRLLDEVRALYPNGFDRTAQHTLFGRHVPESRLKDARQWMIECGYAREESERGNGAPRKVLYARPPSPERSTSASDSARRLTSLISLNSLPQHDEKEKAQALTTLTSLNSHTSDQPLSATTDTPNVCGGSELSEISEVMSGSGDYAGPDEHSDLQTTAPPPPVPKKPLERPNVRVAQVGVEFIVRRGAA